MGQFLAAWGWWLRCLAYLFAATLACISFVSVVIVNAEVNYQDIPNWSSPSAMSIRRMSPIASSQTEPNFLNNLDCNLLTYRLPASSQMQLGCFTDTAFGMIDSDSDVVIFNGTDEGLPILPYSSGEVLVPWPRAGNLIQLDAVATGGSKLSLYKNPLASLQDQRDGLGRLTAKKLSAPAELPLKNGAGQPLIINPQTLAFSDGGSWMIAETLGGSFVRVNLASLDTKAFAPAFGSQGSAGALLKSRVAISDDGHYAAISNEAAASFKVYNLQNCSSETCPAYEYRPFAASQISGLRSIRHLRFINSGLLSFEATSSSSELDGIYTLAPTATINSLIDYLGLGDSYAAGEGAFDYLAGTDDDISSCHQSVNSYPLLLTHDLFSSRGGHSVACSGARINDLVSSGNDYHGQVRNGLAFQDLQQNQPALLGSVITNFLPGYIAQQHFVGQYQPAVVTIMSGGNDIGFGDIIQECVMPHVSLHISDNDCFSSYEDRQELLDLIDRTKPRLVSQYKQLQAKAPSGRYYVVGYPQIAISSGNCSLNVHLSQNELVFAQELIDYLNGAINESAGKAGISYVDISQALAGHRLCETASHNVAANGLTAGKDAGPFGIKVIGRESYHPNALGHELIEQSILHQTTNLTKATTPVTAPPSSQKLLQSAPKTGRSTVTRIPSTNLTSTLLKSGQTATIKANGADSGLRPNTPYNIRIDGSDGSVIGTTQSDDNGNIDTRITLPANTNAGSHIIDVVGPDHTGGTVDLTQPIYVPVSDNDYDGDGSQNNNDSCPIATNSGRDDDKDNIDDACDGIIGQTTSGGHGQGSSVSGTASTPSSGVFPSSSATSKPAMSSLKIPKSSNLTSRLTKPTLVKVSRLKLRFYWLVLAIIAICALILGFCLGKLTNNDDRRVDDQKTYIQTASFELQ